MANSIYSSQIYSPFFTAELVLETTSEALHSAIKDNRCEEAMGLISRMSQDLIGVADRYGQTALHLAANVDDPKMSASLCQALCAKMSEDAICHQTNEGRQTALHFAALEHDLGFVTELKENVSTDCLRKIAGMTDRHGQTPLHYAVDEGCFNMSKLLHEIDNTVVLQADKNDQTALHLAALKKSQDIVELLVNTPDQKTLVEKFDCKQRTALYLAAYVGSFEISELLYNIMKVFVDDKFSAFMRPVCGHTALHAAVHAKSLRVVELLTEDDKIGGALVKAIDKCRQTTLHCAAHEGSFEISKHLYEMMEKLDKELIFSRNDKGQTPLHLATYSKSLEIVNLLTKDPKIQQQLLETDDENEQTALHWAVNVGASAICDRLFELMEANDRSLFKKTKQGEYTALHLAVKAKKRSIVKLLAKNSLKAKELAGKEDAYGQTALHWAAGYGDFEMSSDLYEIMKQEESLQTKTKQNGYTALHLAVHAKSRIVTATTSPPPPLDSTATQTKNDKIVDEVFQIVELLTQEPEGKKLADQLDQYDQTALHWAAFGGHVEICQVLCDRMSPGKIWAQTKDKGQTALHFAVQAGHEAIVDLLTKHKDIGKELIALTNKQGLTALDLAVKEKRLGIQAILKNFEKNISQAPS